MEKIIIDNQSGDTPKITLDKEANVFEICGKSFPENAVEFYSPVIKWINEYAQSPNPETIFTINLDYFNSSSSKKILHNFFLPSCSPYLKIQKYTLSQLFQSPNQ